MFWQRDKKETPEKKLCQVTVRYADGAIEEYAVSSGTKLASVLDGHTTIETHCYHNVEIDRMRPPKYNQSIIDAHENCKVEVYGGASLPTKGELEVLAGCSPDTRLACQVTIEDNMEVRLPHVRLWKPNENRVFDILGNELKINEPAYTEVRRHRKNAVMGDRLCIAFEIGICTLRAALFDVESESQLGAVSCLNPQYEYGHTVADRIEYARNGGAAELWDVLVIGLNKLAKELLELHDIGKERIVRASLVGYTPLMRHFLGNNSMLLSNVARGDRICNHAPAIKLGLDLGKDTELYIIPAIDDICSSGIISCVSGSLHLFNSTTDPVIQIILESECSVGLIYNDLATFTKIDDAAVFGGSGLECGAPYTGGAVSHVRFLASPQLDTIYGDPSTGLTGSALVDTVAYLLKTTMLDKKGNLVNEYSFFRLPDDLYISTDDIQRFRISRAKIRAAIDTLTEIYGLSLKDIASVQICGGFGTTYSIESLLDTGIIPDGLESVCRTYGDMTLQGAGQAIVNTRNMLRTMNALRMSRSIDVTIQTKYAKMVGKYEDF